MNNNIEQNGRFLFGTPGYRLFYMLKSRLIKYIYILIFIIHIESYSYLDKFLQRARQDGDWSRWRVPGSCVRVEGMPTQAERRCNQMICVG